MVFASLNCVWAKYGAALMGCTQAKFFAAASDTICPSLSADSMTVAPSPAIWAEAMSEWTLWG